LDVPVVSGNVSFYNETDRVPIYPTPTVAMVGLLPKVERHVTPWFKSEGDPIVLLGRTQEELGGSEYLKVCHGLVRGTPPWIDLKLERAVQQCCLKAAARGLLRSAHDISDGGLAVALTECCILGPGKSFGAKVELHGPMRADAVLFGESQSRIIVSVRSKDLNRLRDIAARERAPMEIIGEVAGRSLIINPMIQSSIDELKNTWSTALERRLV
jgi:phosphoribosylformylglycinamidine synthase